jgi:hypothetical protein
MVLLFIKPVDLQIFTSILYIMCHEILRKFN